VIQRRESQASLGLILEKHGAIFIALLCFVGNAVWIHFILLDHAEWSNRLLDRVIQATSVSAAFWGVTITLLIGMESQAIISTIKRLGYFRLIVRYLSESLFASFLLLLLSVLLEPLCKRLSPVILTSLWLAFGAWALLTALRTYSVLTKLLARME
jgi:hypothetical protein